VVKVTLAYNAVYENAGFEDEEFKRQRETCWVRRLIELYEK